MLLHRRIALLALAGLFACTAPIAIDFGDAGSDASEEAGFDDGRLV